MIAKLILKKNPIAIIALSAGKSGINSLSKRSYRYNKSGFILI